MSALDHYPGHLVDGDVFASVCADAIRYKALFDCSTGAITSEAAIELISGSAQAGKDKAAKFSVKNLMETARKELTNER